MITAITLRVDLTAWESETLNMETVCFVSGCKCDAAVVTAVAVLGGKLFFVAEVFTLAPKAVWLFGRCYKPC